jgi:hypothetical protein
MQGPINPGMHKPVAGKLSISVWLNPSARLPSDLMAVAWRSGS